MKKTSIPYILGFVFGAPAGFLVNQGIEVERQWRDEYLDKLTRFENSLGSAFYTFKFPPVPPTNWFLIIGCVCTGVLIGIGLAMGLAQYHIKVSKSNISRSGV